MPDNKAARRAMHWSKTRNLTLIVLVIWAVFSLVLPWYARELDSFSFLGFKFGYYIIVQGSLIVFVLLIVVQNMLQDKIDDEFGSGDI
jgi:putative solute:sodium symporter small subunit